MADFWWLEGNGDTDFLLTHTWVGVRRKRKPLDKQRWMVYTI